MRSLKSMVMVLALAVPMAQAAGVAVINTQKVLFESAAAKSYAVEAKKKYGKQVTALEKLESGYGVLQQKLERDGALMSEAERSRLQLEMRRKREDFEVQAQSLKEEKGKSDQAEFGRISPFIDQAVTKVAEAGDYDAVVEISSVRYVKPGADITSKVIEQLNKLTSKK